MRRGRAGDDWKDGRIKEPPDQRLAKCRKVSKLPIPRRSAAPLKHPLELRRRKGSLHWRWDRFGSFGDQGGGAKGFCSSFKKCFQKRRKRETQNIDTRSRWDLHGPSLASSLVGSRRMKPAPSCRVTSENKVFLHAIRNTPVCRRSPGSGLCPG